MGAADGFGRVNMIGAPLDTFGDAYVNAYFYLWRWTIVRHFSLSMTGVEKGSKVVRDSWLVCFLQLYLSQPRFRSI